MLIRYAKHTCNKDRNTREFTVHRKVLAQNSILKWFV